MTLDYFKHQLRECLNEQEISWKENDSVQYLCLKAAIEGYSFSDEMILDFEKFIPTEKEIEKYK